MKWFYAQVILLLVIGSSSVVFAAEVKNLKVAQEGGNAVATYDLVGRAGEREADVAVAIIIDGRRRTSERLSLTGDFGKNVKIGTGKRVVWNALEDLPQDFEGELGWDIAVAGNNGPGPSSNLDKAVKIGSGKNIVIEFTDPDCPYCRKGSAFFEGRTDVTRYVFLNPLPMHPEAKRKAGYILSSPNQARAYSEIMGGLLDGRQLAGITETGMKLLEEHMAYAREERIDGTPTYIVNARKITGFNVKELKSALGD